MATDRSLASLLRALQDAGKDEEALPRLLGSATTLLTLLSNPLNVTLLTAQLLFAPALWSLPDGLRTTARVMAVFQSAGIQVLKNEKTAMTSNVFSPRRNLAKEDWIIAVMKGADDRSPRWRHVLVLGGLLLGLEGQDWKGLSESLRTKLGAATVLALNLALQEIEEGPELAVNSIVMVLGFVFGILNDYEKNEINHDLLLPQLFWASFFSGEGLHFGYFLSTMDADIVEGANHKFDWSTKSSSYLQVQRMALSPLLASLGSLSRLFAYSVDHVRNVDLLPTLLGDIAAFTRSLCVQWRQNKLSEIDFKEESTYLSDETIKRSLPLLWQVLKSSMFSIVVVSTSLLEHVLGDARMPADGAPYMAIQTLHILRNLYFVSSRMGAYSFSQHKFIYLAAIDILSQHPIQAEAFLEEIRPAETGLIPEHPLDRCHDLYFLNTAEHFALVLKPQVNEDLLIAAATPYLGVGSDQRLMEIFEAAHSVMLVVFSAPQNSEIVANHIHSYVDALFKVFPQNLSPRQFRMAVKSLIKITSPPSPISADQPLLSSTLLELVRMRSETASSTAMPPAPAANGNAAASEVGVDNYLPEQCVLVLTLIDTLPFLSLDSLEEWLPITAQTVKRVQDAAMRKKCENRFWEVLISGEMDCLCSLDTALSERIGPESLKEICEQTGFEVYMVPVSKPWKECSALARMSLKGRHDPCAVSKAVTVPVAMATLSALWIRF